MGIDVYMTWDKQTKQEKEAQYTGFDVTAGNVGYLREAYHGGPYATPVLINREWDQQPEGGFPIPAAELRKRLPETVLTALYRDYAVYGERLDNPAEIHLDKDGDLLTALAGALADAATVGKRQQETFTPNDEQLRAVKELIATRKLPAVALAFVDFVELAEKIEAKTGKPVRVIVSA